MRIGLLFAFLVAAVFADKKEELQAKIQEMNQRIQKEKEFFGNYQSKRNSLREDKKKEIDRLKKDLEQSRYDLNALKAKIRSSEASISNYELENKEINARFREVAQSIKMRVLNGIPYDRQRRAAVLTSIISDIDSGVSSPTEILNRIVTFLDEEDILAYDSQSFLTTEKIGGKEVNVTVLRVGRVLFFVDDGKEVYPYKKDSKGNYVLDEEHPLGVQDRLAVRDAIHVLSGQKPPDILDLPVSSLLKQIDEGGKL